MAALGPFERRPRLAVAVSGGADSLALTLLANRWSRARGGEVVGLHVDHRLRTESSAEARTVQAWLGAHGIDCRILVREGPVWTSAVQARAREARYTLLHTACRELGCLHLLVGHQADDQRETVRMRQQRQTAGDSLTGMPAVRELDATRILRPLLAIPHARLAATLRTMRQRWLDDPSNRAERFERVRVRQELAAAPAGFTQSPMPITAAAALRAQRESKLAQKLAGLARPHPLGWLTLVLMALMASPDADALLARAIVAVSGAIYPPRRDAVSRLCGLLHDQQRRQFTLGGCLLIRRGADLAVVREPRAASEQVTVTAPAQISWDHRFRLTITGPPEPVQIAALGSGGLRELTESRRAAMRRAGVPGRALATLPAVRHRDRVVAVGGLGCGAVSGEGTEWCLTAEWRPARPLAGVSFVGECCLQATRSYLRCIGAPDRPPAVGATSQGTTP